MTTKSTPLRTRAGEKSLHISETIVISKYASSLARLMSKSFESCETYYRYDPKVFRSTNEGQGVP